MGICLDTDKNDGSQDYDDTESRGVGPWLARMDRNPGLGTPPEGAFPMQNETHVQFEVPKVPVIFVLGGPGSGKVTHCDNIIQEKRGLTHINMTDLLQQYTIGNEEVKDFSFLSSSTVTEVLMLEMKMSPAAKAFLISGYPRNMRDVVEYSDKIKTISKVILIAWRQSLLERQINYGAKLGHVILSLARMELANFYQNVTPVTDFFDQRGMLIAVNGERNPVEVYADFRTAVLKILNKSSPTPGPEPNNNPLPNGTAVPVPEIPSQVQSIAATVHSPPKQYSRSEPSRKNKSSEGKLPFVIWVMGGPGSSKSEMCEAVLKDYPNWTQLSLGKLLRYFANIEDDGDGLNSRIKSSVSAGDFVSRDVVLDIVYEEMKKTKYMEAVGIVMDGFPREMSQMVDFENKFQTHPPMILLDCSKLVLHKGQLDNSVSAFRKRLELFRERTLPMLRAMDVETRLTIVDGDTQIATVREEFERVLRKTIHDLENSTPGQRKPTALSLNENKMTVHDLESAAHVDKHTTAVPNGFGPPREKRTMLTSSHMKDTVHTISKNVPMNREMPRPSLEQEDPL
uniref:Adenylate kinase isoenzyme 5 n=2 Tax=Cacopsylla melanoneura TaxID=428564 RepID=A0A8D8Z4X1_9HEMI